MSREIQFRGKLMNDSKSFHYKKGQTIYGGYYREASRHFIVAHSNVFEVEPESVGQFTGFYDRNKVKIFEKAHVKMPEGFHPEIRQVVFDCFGRFVFGNLGVSFGQLATNDVIDVEVVNDDLKHYKR
jgi:hypothetical protein